jgi:polyphosphate kinase
MRLRNDPASVHANHRWALRDRPAASDASASARAVALSLRAPHGPGALMDAPQSRELFGNRELGLLAFNKRVLAQAQDRATPLLERLRFLCILSNNLDEFFEIRVAGLRAAIQGGSQHRDSDGLTAAEAFELVAAEAHRLVADQYRALNDEILPELAQAGVMFLRRGEFTEAQSEWIKDYFYREVMPVLTPIGLDPAHPFPQVVNKSLNFAVELEGEEPFGRQSGIAIVQAPRVLPRVIRVPSGEADSGCQFVFLSSIMHVHIGALFPGMTVLDCYQFRLTRNSELFVDEEEVKDLIATLQGELHYRHFGKEVRLEIDTRCSDRIAKLLREQFALRSEDIYVVDGPVNLVRLMYVPDAVARPELKFPTFHQGLPAALREQRDIFAAMQSGDILLHHPFESFEPVLDFLEQAATDPFVVAIKQTVYRTGSESQVMQKLISAAHAGKEVTVVVELLARFDEEANINWAQRLEDAGAHVVYGMVGHKAHAKMLMVVRREETGLKRYVHLSTGNYHSNDSRLYTDFGMLTCRDLIGADVDKIFMQLTGLGRATGLAALIDSPFRLHHAMVGAIRREAEHARAGSRARIVAKMNALLEPAIIAELYAASQAGVSIELIVRGVCALRPGIPGTSDNIRVVSVVGRFLEHARVFHFHNDGAEDVYLSSADWMERNFFRRVEVCFPVVDAELKQRVIREGLTAYLRDNVQAWRMDANGDYSRVSPGNEAPYCAQDDLLRARQSDQS